VPGLGAFIAHYTPAQIDRELGCIFPPKRNLTFNPELSHNDGLLATSIARRNGVTFDNAMAAIKDEVTLIRTQVESNGEYAIGRLGILGHNPDGTMLFTPFTTNTCSRYSGLLATAAKPLKATETFAADTTLKPRKASSGRNLVKMVASIALLICLGFMWSTPIVDTNTNLASIASNINVTSPKANVEKAPILSPNIELAIAIPNPAIATAEATPIRQTKDEVVSETVVPQAHRYYLVIASLPTKAKAEEYIAAHTGKANDLNVVSSSTRHRVYTASFATIDEAQAGINAAGFLKQHPDAWIYKK
jgi:hypothetical protein